MKTRNITMAVSLALALVWIIIVSAISTIIIGSNIAAVLAIPVGVAGSLAILSFFRGDRLWITDGDRLPVGFLWKPRGYTKPPTMRSKDNTDSNTATCIVCLDDFPIAEDHLHYNEKHYCRSCSKIGKIVMENHRQFFDTVDEIQNRRNL